MRDNWDWEALVLAAGIVLCLLFMAPIGSRRNNACSHCDRLFVVPRGKCPVWLDSQFKRQAVAFQYPVQSSRSHCKGWPEHRIQLIHAFVDKYMNTVFDVLEQHMRMDLGPHYDLFIESAMQSRAT